MCYLNYIRLRYAYSSLGNVILSDTRCKMQEKCLLLMPTRCIATVNSYLSRNPSLSTSERSQILPSTGMGSLEPIITWRTWSGMTTLGVMKFSSSTYNLPCLLEAFLLPVEVGQTRRRTCASPLVSPGSLCWVLQIEDKMLSQKCSGKLQASCKYAPGFAACLAVGAPGAVASPKFGAGLSFLRLQGNKSWWS